jgi:hypothetical protein
MLQWQTMFVGYDAVVGLCHRDMADKELCRHIAAVVVAGKAAQADLA